MSTLIILITSILYIFYSINFISVLMILYIFNLILNFYKIINFFFLSHINPFVYHLHLYL